MVSRLVIEKASLNNVSICPDWRWSSRWLMIVLIVSLSRCFFDVGARISNSRWTSNHQYGVAASRDCDLIIDSIILAWIV